MSRIAPRHLALLAVPLATLLGIQTTSCDSTNASDGGGGGGGGGGNINAPPVITAAPVSGEYAQNQSVSLSSNESASIYYYLTTDPNDPTLPDPDLPGSYTGSGSAPLTGIALVAPTDGEVEYRLSYLGVDNAGATSVAVSSSYLIDRLVPTLLQSSDPAPIGLFDTATVMWSATDDGTYVATLGGDGTPGSGVEVAAGNYPEPPPGMAFPTLTIDVSGLDLPLGASDVPLTLFFSDGAGNEVSAQWSIDQKALHGAPLPTGASELAVAPGIGAVYVVDAAADQVLVLDPVAGTAETPIDVDPMPNGLALTPDQTALYVSCGASIQHVDLSTALVSNTILVAGGTPSGVTATPDGARVYFTVDDGTLAYLDTTNDMVVATSVSGQSWQSSHMAVTPDAGSERLAIAWTGAAGYSIELYDAVGDALLSDPLGTVAGGASFPGRIVTTSALGSQTAYAGGLMNQLTRFDLSTSSIGQFVNLATGGLALTRSDARLMLSRADSLELGVRDPNSLFNSLATYDVGLPADAGIANLGIGPALVVATWTDGFDRLYFVKNPATASAELIGVALE